MQQALSTLARKYYVDQMREQVQSLFAKLDAFPPAPAPRSDDASLEDQLLSSMLDLLTLKLAAGDPDRNLPAHNRRRAVSADSASPQASETSLQTAVEQPTAELANKPTPAAEAAPATAAEPVTEPAVPAAAADTAPAEPAKTP